MQLHSRVVLRLKRVVLRRLRAPLRERSAVFRGKHGEFITAAAAVARKDRLRLVKLAFARAVAADAQKHRREAQDGQPRKRGHKHRRLMQQQNGRGLRRKHKCKQRKRDPRAVFAGGQAVKFPHIALRAIEKPVFLHAGKRRGTRGPRRRGRGRLRRGRGGA